MSAYYSNQPPSPGSPSPPAGTGPSMAAAAAAAAFHWTQFPDFSPYYLNNHSNLGQRYQSHHHHHHLSSYHHPNQHFNGYSNHHHHHQAAAYSSPHSQALFGGSLPITTTPNFPASIKPDPNQDDRNENFIRDETVVTETENFPTGSPPASNITTAATTTGTTAATSNTYLPHHQQQQPAQQQQTNNNTINGSNNTSLNNLLPSCGDNNTNILSNAQLQPQQHHQTLVGGVVPHPGSSPNFSCISPPTLPMSGTDPAAAMAAMTASQGGYYDMYGGGGGGGSFGAKGSSFYPWMKNYSGKTREVFFAIITLVCHLTTTLSIFVSIRKRGEQ